MNREAFLKELTSQTNYNMDECNLINDIIEDNNIVGRKNKQKIINDFMSRLNIDESEADMLYDVVMGIIVSELKNKLTSPLK